MSRSRNRSQVRRRQLLAEHPFCFYCGLGFPPEGLALPSQEVPGWDKLWLRARPTLEHLHPRSRGGTTARTNTVLAHSWCNTVAGDLPLLEKLQLREEMRRAVRMLRSRDPGLEPVVIDEPAAPGPALAPRTAEAPPAGVVRHLVIDGLLRLVVENVQARPRPTPPAQDGPGHG